MKKFLSICLCAALLTGGFGGGLSAFAAKTSTEVTSTDEILYPASDTPDKINEVGQKAINAQSYTTEDGVCLLYTSCPTQSPKIRLNSVFA